MQIGRRFGHGMGNGPDNTKYSALDQIDRLNFHELQVAWEWESVSTPVADANKGVKPGQFKPIPIMLDGVVYVATEVAQAAAIDAATGETLWSYDPESWRAGRPANVGFQHRGVAAWRGPVGGGPFLGDIGQIAVQAGLDLTEEQIRALSAGTTPKLVALALP